MGQYYVNLLDQLHLKICGKRPALARKKVMFHQDNAHTYTCVVVMVKIYELRCELLPHPPYSPGVAPSDFTKLKIFLGGWRFS